MAVSISILQAHSRYMADRFDVMANMVRARLESGSLRAEEIQSGVQLTHQEFLYLYDHARRSMYAQAIGQKETPEA